MTHLPIISSIDNHIDLIDRLRTPNYQKKILQMCELVLSTLRNGRTVFWCGNGGSAADSQHYSAELIGRYKKNRPAYSSISLSSDVAALTCIANDFNYSEIFSRQIQGLARPDDLLIALTTSGKSKNVVNAITQASSQKLRTISLLGSDGGDAKGLATVELIVPSHVTARIQEAHALVCHIICEYVDERLDKTIE